MARYFIVEPTPLRMRPGLFKLGQDFGNGPADRAFFQRDDQRELYEQEKRRVLALHPKRLDWLEDSSIHEVLQRVGAWMLRQIEDDAAAGSRDWTGAFQGPSLARSEWLSLSLAIQEDFAVVQLDQDGSDRLVLTSVAFPSGWQPEEILGQSFSKIHTPVVEFEEVASKSQQIVRAMVERGPYVRFVWTVTADARLDHHPRHAPRDPWSSTCIGYLRVERQVTVPFPRERLGLFLIRTYLYPFPSLSPEERATLLSAVDQLSPAIAEYKGLTVGLPHIREKLKGTS